jgi:NAD(P)-dependent dehydrogenase (short-subunit alcohol dehydrogenase family)
MCKNFEDIDLNNVQSTFQSNILQMFAVTKFALPHLKRGSAIVNTTSVTGYKGSPSLGARPVSLSLADSDELTHSFKSTVDYSSTKGAIISFTRSLAVQLAPKGIRVNAVAPGPVITALQPASRSPENMEGFGVGLPLHGRAGLPAELGPSFVFLASSDSNLMTGQVLHVNSRCSFPNETGYVGINDDCRWSTYRCLVRCRSRSSHYWRDKCTI